MAIDRGLSNCCYSVWLSVVLSALLLTGCEPSPSAFSCTDAIGCVHIGPEAPIKLATLQPLSGGVRAAGVDNLRAIELALDGRDNRLLGHPMALQIEDTGCTQGGGTTSALKVVADPQVVAIVGSDCSVAAVTAAQIMSEAGLVMISGANTLPSLTSVAGTRGIDWQPGYFRTAHNDVNQGRAAASFAFQELGVRKAATINDGDPYTRGLAEVFGQAFTKLGGEIVLATGVNKGDTNMGPVLTAVSAAQAELVFFPIFPPEGDYIVQQIKQNERLRRTILMSADGLLDADFIESVGRTGVGMYFVTPTTPQGAAYAAFIAQYQAKYSESPLGSSHTQTYDAANMLLDAISAVVVQEENGTLHIGRQALRDALYAMKDFEGLTGRLSCDAFGDCGAVRFDMVRLQDPAGGLEGLVNNVIYAYTPDEAKPHSGAKSR